MVLFLLVQAFWLIAPAYAANGFPPLIHGKRPIDRGKEWRGRRILGDGKTIEGTIGGIVFGILIASLLIAVQDRFSSELALIALPVMTLELGAALGSGAVFGDILGSFIKRRFDVKRGDSVLLLDQLGFLLMALLLAYLVHPFHPLLAITLIILTPPIHLLSNILGYYIRVKKQPW